jgi:hypothetical protein
VVDGGHGDGGGALICGTAGVCPEGDYCLITEGGVVILDAGNKPTYKCTPFPATCGSSPSCSCISGTEPTCMCVESSAGFTVTCEFP